MKNQEMIPFPDELEHLDHTLKIIDTALTEAREDVLRLDQEYRDAKRYMAEYRNEMQITEIMIRIMTGICSIFPVQELCIN
ncbi:MAG: hypothetical protein MR531_12840 [Lachnospiraceae bacterium]|nr:hypothetical protein [Lachnospiraceae bacterium]